jgi:hypothetical protein
VPRCALKGALWTACNAAEKLSLMFSLNAGRWFRPFQGGPPGADGPSQIEVECSGARLSFAPDEINIGDLVFDNRISVDVGRVPHLQVVSRLFK